MRRSLLLLLCSFFSFSSCFASLPRTDAPTPAWYQLDNGFQVVNYGPDGSQEILTLTLQVYVGWRSEHRDQRGLAELLRQSIWQGTIEHSRLQILQVLDGLEMDAECNGYTLPDSTIYSLTVPADNSPELERALHLLAHLAFHATLIDRDIEIVRQFLQEESEIQRHVFDLSDPKDYAYTAREVIRHMPPARVRSFYRNAYSPGNMVLHVTGAIPDGELFELADYAFGDQVSRFGNNETAPSFDRPQHPAGTNHESVSPSAELSAFITSLQQDGVRHFSHSGSDYELVDGKVLMDSASWYETRMGRRLITWGSVGAGLACLWLGQQQSMPQLTWTGFGLEGLGLYGFTFLNFDNDPAVCGEKRQHLLAGNFSEAIQVSNVQRLLTPIELRLLFIAEYREQPSVAAMSKNYDLFRQPFTDMFSREELELLREGIAEYRHRSTELRRLRRALEERLQDALAPERAGRDRLLARIEQEYESNYFVVEERRLADYRNKILRGARTDYDQRVLDARYGTAHLSESELEERLQDAQNELDRRTNHANEDYRRSVRGAIEVGLTQARNIRDSARAEVQKDFTDATARAKSRIGYEEEQRMLQECLAELDNDSNAGLANALSRLPDHAEGLRDYVLCAALQID